MPPLRLKLVINKKKTGYEDFPFLCWGVRVRVSPCPSRGQPLSFPCPSRGHLQPLEEKGEAGGLRGQRGVMRGWYPGLEEEDARGTGDTFVVWPRDVPPSQRIWAAHGK